jgi:VanZ family protein
VRRQVLLYAAIFWSVLVLYFCLKNANDLKQIDIVGFDKFIHVVFHFVFTLLWFLYVRKKFYSSNKNRLVLGSFLFSFLFGIVIEIMQEMLTTTRSADVFDILANFFGAFLSAVTVFLFDTRKKQSIKSIL